jgi:hypothetical protein
MKNNGLAFLGITMGIILDVYGIICLGADKVHLVLGEMMSLVGDGVGIICFMAWTAIMCGGIGALKNLKNKGVMQKYLMTSFGEVLPIIGGLPLWTLYAISMSTNNRDPKQKVIIADEEEEPEDENIEEAEDEEEYNEDDSGNQEPEVEMNEKDSDPKDEDVEENDLDSEENY